MSRCVTTRRPSPSIRCRMKRTGRRRGRSPTSPNKYRAMPIPSSGAATAFIPWAGATPSVRYAKIIYDEATRAVQIDSNYDMAHHVLGAWNAEVKRLSGFQRFFAKALFGGGFMSKANWPDAVSHLERAVAIRPDWIYHRLELAQVYVDIG